MDVYKKQSYVSAGTLVAVVTGAAILAAGCGSSGDRPRPSGPTAPPSQVPGSTPAVYTVPPPIGTSSATAALPDAAVAKPDFPRAVTQLEHGGTYWGVYITVVRTGDGQQISPEDQKRLDAAAKSLTDWGYNPDSGAFDAGCEQGFVEQLRLDPPRQYAATRIFFANDAQAQQFVKAYQPGVVGTAKVTLSCMD
jgi:hypothetical protein